jgi:Asp-tRNA(Asn)/Glu-tRNA(Gln) amidotransferase A subunit family amidase
MNGLTVLPAVELLAMLRRKQISPLELADEYIEQIERLNPQLHALVDFDAERVREQARALQDASGSRGPLFGLPMTIKASIATAGYRCELGSLLHRGHIPPENATVVDRAKQAGALILGTTNCPEFLMAYETDNRLYGRTGNPWDTERTAGGSSGGESAAIAAGLSAGGLGSASRLTSPASAHSNRHRAAFPAAVIWLQAMGPSRSWARLGLWRALSAMSRYSLSPFPDRMHGIR